MTESSTTTNKLPLLKRLWGSKVADPSYEACKLLNKMKKDTKFGGEGKYVVIAITMQASGGANFQDAMATQAAEREVRFFVPHKKQYVLWSLQRDVISRSQGDVNAVMSALKRALEGARKKWARISARRTYGNHGGTIARLRSTTTLTGAVGILSAGADVAAFEKYMQIGFASDDGSASSPAGLRNSGGVPTYLTVDSVDRNSRTVTFTANLNTVPSIAATDYMFWRGDYAQTMCGLSGWNPVTAPSGGESFFGLDRTATDVQRLSGIRVTGTGTMIETLEDACAEAKLQGSVGQDYVLPINPLDFAKLRKELGGNAEMYDVDATIGFKAIKLATQVGEVTILNETDVPQGYSWLVDASEMTLRTAGDFPEDVTDTSGGLLVDYTDDAKQGRFGAYGNFFHDNPGSSVVITWPS